VSQEISLTGSFDVQAFGPVCSLSQWQLSNITRKTRTKEFLISIGFVSYRDMAGREKVGIEDQNFKPTPNFAKNN
jgi:hypothetical protein